MIKHILGFVLVMKNFQKYIKQEKLLKMDLNILVPLDEIQASLEKMSEELEKINEKYDEEEFRSYLLENCESAKDLFEMSSKAIQELEAVEEIEE